jgi:hypothetical protein
MYTYVHTDGQRDFSRHWTGMLGYVRRKLENYLTSSWLQTIFLNTSYYRITPERTVMCRLLAKHTQPRPSEALTVGSDVYVS